MKTKIIITLLLILTLAFTPYLWASTHKKVGTTSASFLKVGIDAKVSALGNAFGAEYGGSSSILYNPAGINLEEEIGQLGLMYNNSIMDTHYGFLSFLNSKNKNLSYGVSLLYAIAKGIKETTHIDPQGKNGRGIAANDLVL